MQPLKISIIIPCLNEADNIGQSLGALQPLRTRGHEIILVDGNSSDNTASVAAPLVDQLLYSSPGRARQMNHGAEYATGDVFCFVHADTLCPENFDQLLSGSLKQSKKMWGRFDIRLSSERWPFRFIEWFINKRSFLSGIASGDQGIFICRNIFKKLSGFADIPIMEDIEMSRRLRKISRPLCISQQPLVTSSRRWEKHGILRTIVLMWLLRLKFFFGAPAQSLSKSYINHASNK